MKFTLVAFLIASLSGVQAVPAPQITGWSPAECPLKECGTATITATPSICPAVLCPTAPICPLIASVTFVPCCCKTEKIPTITSTGPCCTTKCVIPTFTEYSGCPTPTPTPTKVTITKKTTTTRRFITLGPI
ncbi:hypothetical protein ABW19_dt0206454 [Dactylella cylindrospora]|nr:hypothetical protein ABW19_dt0206454 [Dactylella cylindrospora]